MWGGGLFLDRGKCFFVASGNILPAAAAGADATLQVTAACAADAALQETAARFEDCAADEGRGVIFGRGKVFLAASDNLLPAAAAGADAGLQETAVRFGDCAVGGYSGMESNAFRWQATISFRQLQPGLMLPCRRQPLALGTVLLMRRERRA